MSVGRLGGERAGGGEAGRGVGGAALDTSTDEACENACISFSRSS